MIDENSLNSDLEYENKLITLIPEFFENLPKKSSEENPNTSLEIIQNFCYRKTNYIKNFNLKIYKKIVNVLYVKSKSISNNQEKDISKKIIQNLNPTKNHLSYLDKIFQLLNVNKLKN